MSKQYLNKTQLNAELEKCLQCPTKPCKKACPAQCSPYDFIANARMQKWAEAASEIANHNPLGEVCGLICPDKFCQKACLRQHVDYAIKIPSVQATIMQIARVENLWQPMVGKPIKLKVAVVGAGPAGIGATAELVKAGYSVEVYEAASTVGGVLNLIPQARLQREITVYEWQKFIDTGRVKIHLNTSVADYSLLLNNGFCAVIVAKGEQKPRELPIEGKELAVQYTTYLAKPEIYKNAMNVAVIGGGAVAVDCATTAKQFGATHVEMFVRRQINNMRVTAQEREVLLQNQIDLTTMTRVAKLERQQDKLALYSLKTQFNAEGKLVDIPKTMICRQGFDLVVFALGSERAEEICESERIVFAGDIVNGGSTAVEAVASGKAAAEKIIKYFNQ